MTGLVAVGRARRSRRRCWRCSGRSSARRAATPSWSCRRSWPPIGAATGHWPFRPHLLGDTGYFRLVGGDLHDGLDRWVRTLLPYDPAKAPELHAVVVLAIFACFSALAAALLVWRSPYPAIVVGFIPFLVVSTVYVLPRPTLRAAIFLGADARRSSACSRSGRRPTIQLAAGATVVLVAVLAATLPGVAKSAMLDWKQWGKPEKTGDERRLHLEPHVRRPEAPEEAGHAAARDRRQPVLLAGGRARQLQRPRLGGRADRGRHRRRRPNAVVPQDALSPTAQGLSLKQKSAKFQNVNLATNNLVAPGEVLAIKGIDGDAGLISRTADGVFSTDKNVPVDSSWTVEYLPVQPSIKDLTEAPADYPEELQATSLALLDESVVFPAWGTPGREATVDDLLSQHFFDPQLVRWREVYDKAREITAGREVAVRGGRRDRVVLPVELQVRREGRLLAGGRRPAAVVLPRRQERLLPDVRRHDDRDAAHARHPVPRRRGLHRGHAQRQPRHLRRHRPRRPRVGRGVVPEVRLDGVRADAVARAAVQLLDDVEGLLGGRAVGARRASPASTRPGSSSSRSWPARRAASPAPSSAAAADRARATSASARSSAGSGTRASSRGCCCSPPAWSSLLVLAKRLRSLVPVPPQGPARRSRPPCAATWRRSCATRACPRRS